jgi:hypothetical protein
MYLSKSDFQLASSCAKKLVYKKKRYPTSNDTNEYMEMLAQGGYVIGKMATLLYPSGIEIKGTTEQALARTKELLQENETIILFEPAFEFEQRLARVDILVKEGNLLKLIEVKSASFDSTSQKKKLDKKKQDKYVNDIAYQYTILKDNFPEAEIECYLLMPDKSIRTSIDGLAGWFQVTDPEISDLPKYDSPEELKAQEKSRFKKPDVTFLYENHPDSNKYLQDLKEKGILNDLNVTAEVLKLEEFIRNSATKFIRILNDNLQTSNGDYEISKTCKGCEFFVADDPKCGFFECWKDTNVYPSIFDMYYGGEIRGIEEMSHWNELIKAKKYEFEDINPELLINTKGEVGPRALRQQTQYQNTLTNTEWYSNELSLEINQLQYPLHFIDFETYTGATPFHDGMRTYEMIAFQWSCHTINYPGAVPEHKEFIDTDNTLPNFRFAEALMMQIGTSGTPLMWSHHENTVLRTIYYQMELFGYQNPALKTWLEGIIKDEKLGLGGRLVDMNKLTVRHYFHPEMKGRTSIKKVLPAIWNNHTYLHGIPHFSPYAEVDINNMVIDPYDKLSELIKNSDDSEETYGELEDVKGGTAAMRAYQRIRFDQSLTIEQRSELKKRLLEYCKLDTMAMVIIYEHWKNLTR